MAFGIGQVAKSVQTIDSFNQKLSETAKKAKSMNKPLDRSRGNFGAVFNHAQAASMALGLLASAWAAVIDRAKNDNAEFKESVNSINDSLGELFGLLVDGMLPMLETFADVLQVVIGELKKHPGVVKALGFALGIVLSALTALTVQYAATTTAAMLQVMAFEAAAGAAWMYNAALTAAQVTMGAATMALRGLAAAAMSNPLGAVLVALSLFFVLAQQLQGSGLVAWVEGVAESLAGLVPSIGEVVTFLKQLVGIGGEPKGMAKWAKYIIQTAFPVLFLVEAIVEGFQYLSSVLSNTDFSGVLAGLVPSDLVGRLTSIAEEAGPALVRTLASGILGPGAAPLLSALSSALGPLGALLPSSDAERGPLSNLTGAGAALVKTIATGVLSAPLAIAEAVGSVLAGALGRLGSVALSLGSEIASGIASGIEATAGAITGAVSGAISGAADAATGAANAASGVADAAAGTVTGAVGAAGSVAADAGNAAAGAARAAGDVAGGIGNAAGGMADAAGGLLGGGSQTQHNNAQIHFHGEVHDAQKIDKKVRKAQRQAVKQAQGGIEDALDMGMDTANSLI